MRPGGEKWDGPLPTALSDLSVSTQGHWLWYPAKAQQGPGVRDCS